MKLSLIIPAYNEAAVLSVSLVEVRAFLDERRFDAEVIAVDDGSTDETGAILARHARADRRMVPLRLQFNQGKGAAIRHAVRYARGSIVAFIDADLPYPLTAIEEALRHIGEAADMAIGTRLVLGPLPRRGYSPSRRLLSASFGTLVQLAFGLDLADTQCGFKAFEAEAARALFASSTIRGFAFDVEILLLARHWGLRVEQIPLQMKHSPRSSARVLREAPRIVRDLAALYGRLRRGQLPPHPQSLTRRDVARQELDSAPPAPDT